MHCQINFTDLKKMQLRSKYVPSLSFVSSVTPALGGIFDVRLVSRCVMTDSFCIIEIIAVPFYHDTITEAETL